jgi:hypothetical protein
MEPEEGSMGSCPERNSVPFYSMAWEYGPTAFGALGEAIVFFIS